AFAAKLLGVPACVVLPIGVPLAKLTAIQRAGAETVLTGESYDEAHAAALEIARERKRSYVHAFDDDDVIAGQGTLALELLDDAQDGGAARAYEAACGRCRCGRAGCGS